jgi:hypothetical protein
MTGNAGGGLELMRRVGEGAKEARLLERVWFWVGM